MEKKEKKEKKENTIISLKYFNIIQLLNEFYLNYLKTYHSISKEYHTKIYNLQKENNTKMKEIINKMDKNESTDFSQIIKFINVLPNIIDLFLENLGYLIKDLEKEMKSHKNFLEEKKILVSKFKSQFEEAKNDYIKKENEIYKLQNSFFNNMTNLEEIIYKFYSSQESKKTNKIKIDKNKNGINININVRNSVTMEQVNNQINNTKKIEKNYKEIIESAKIFQDNYIQLENSSSENIKGIIIDISLQLKQSIMNLLMPLKNIFKIPDKEIDNCLPDLISTDGKKNINTAMNDYFEKNIIPKKEYVIKKYDLQVLKTDLIEDNRNKNINKNNKFFKINFVGKKNDLSKGETKVSMFEDGLEEMPFINDEFALHTTRKMIKNFELINNKGFDIKIEEEKATTKKLSKKIVFNFKKPIKNRNNKKENKNNEKENNIEKKNNINNIKNNINNNIENNIINNDNKIIEDSIENDNNDDEFVIIDSDKDLISISEEEIKLFEILLNKHHNRIIFNQTLNEFRTTGKLIIPKMVFEIVGKFYNIILNTVKRDNDIQSARNVILLSQTYYTLENGKKKYLQELIINNELFKDIKFWEDLLDLELTKEIKKLYKIEENNQKLNFEGVFELDPHKFDNLAFSQIITISDNMINFGVDKETIYKLIEPKIESFKMSQENIQNIKNILDQRFKEKKEEEENK